MCVVSAADIGTRAAIGAAAGLGGLVAPGFGISNIAAGSFTGADIDAFAPICNYHDVCFETPGRTVDQCNNALFGGIVSYCNTFFPPPSPPDFTVIGYPTDPISCNRDAVNPCKALDQYHWDSALAKKQQAGCINAAFAVKIGIT